MIATKLASKAVLKVRMPFSIGQQVRICQGVLAGIPGTLAEMPTPGRATIHLQHDIYLEIDQSFLEPVNAEER